MNRTPKVGQKAFGVRFICWTDPGKHSCVKKKDRPNFEIRKITAIFEE